jgi:hypothetical protein
MRDELSIIKPGLDASRKTWALLTAGLAAWTLTTVVDLGPAFGAWFAKSFLDYKGYVPEFSQGIFWLSAYAVVGLPIALLVSFAVGAPVWDRAEAEGRTRKRDAVWAGARAGLIVGLVSLAFTGFMALKTALDDNTSFNSYWWGRATVLDGVPTLLGSMLELAELFVTVGTGALAGLSAWWVGTSRL